VRATAIDVALPVVLNLVIERRRGGADVRERVIAPERTLRRLESLLLQTLAIADSHGLRPGRDRLRVAVRVGGVASDSAMISAEDGIACATADGAALSGAKRDLIRLGRTQQTTMIRLLRIGAADLVQTDVALVEALRLPAAPVINHATCHAVVRTELRDAGVGPNRSTRCSRTTGTLGTSC
jgi:hypothetical protein